MLCDSSECTLTPSPFPADHSTSLARKCAGWIVDDLESSNGSEKGTA